MRGRMAGMPQFSLKSVLLGLTSAAIGMGMLALAFHETQQPTSKEAMLLHAFLVAFGGALVGFGVSFPLRFPPYRYVLAMMGMFAALAWEDSHSFVGLYCFAGMFGLLVSLNEVQRRIAKRRE